MISGLLRTKPKTPQSRASRSFLEDGGGGGGEEAAKMPKRTRYSRRVMHS